MGGIGAAWAAMEGFSRSLAAELGPRGVRVVCLRSHGMPETPAIGDAVQGVLALHAEATGLAREQVQALWEGETLLRRLPTLAEVASVAAFMASDRAGPMTGTVANLTGGAIVD